MSKTLGRLPAALVGKSIPYDAPERVVQALLTANDQMIDAVQALCAKLDSNHGAATDHVATISAKLAKIDLIQ